MPAIQHSIPEGTTEPQTFTAYVDDAIVDMTGFTLALQVYDKNENLIAVTGTVAWEDATLAQWRYTPNGQLTVALSPYWVRAKITLGDGSIVFSPNTAQADRWDIERP